MLREDAHWMTQAELTNEFHAHLHTTSAVQVGLYGQLPLYLTAERLKQRVLVIEAPGASSPQRISHILAWFLLNAAMPQSSFVVLDPQGDLKRLLAGTLGKTHTLFEVSLSSVKDCLHYNPLYHIPLIDDATPEARGKTGCRQLQAASALAHVLAQPFSAPNLHYPDLPKLISQALLAGILHLRVAEPFAPFHRLQECVRSEGTLFAALANSPSEQARMLFEQQLADINNPLLKNTLFRVLSIVTDPQEFRKVTVQNDIDFTCLLREPVALFLTPSLSNEDSSRTFATLFFTQLFLSTIYAYEDLERDPQEEDKMAPYHLRFVLNDFLTHCQPPFLEEHLQHLQRYGAGLIASGPYSVSDDGQDVETELLGRMCATHLVLNGASLSDCEQYSHLCGSTVTTTQAPIDMQQKREPLISPFAIHTLNRGSALLYHNDGAPAIITLRNVLDSQNSTQASQLFQPHTTNQGSCFDELTPATLIGERQSYRPILRRRNTSAEERSARSLFKEFERSVLSFAQDEISCNSTS